MFCPFCGATSCHPPVELCLRKSSRNSWQGNRGSEQTTSQVVNLICFTEHWEGGGNHKFSPALVTFVVSSSKRHGSGQRWQFTQRSAALCITSLRPGVVNSIYHGLVPHCRHYQVTELKLDSSGWQLCPFIPVSFVCLWHHLVVGGLLSTSPD